MEIEIFLQTPLSIGFFFKVSLSVANKKKDKETNYRRLSMQRTTLIQVSANPSNHSGCLLVRPWGNWMTYCVGRSGTRMSCTSAGNWWNVCLFASQFIFRPVSFSEVLISFTEKFFFYVYVISTRFVLKFDCQIIHADIIF